MCACVCVCLRPVACPSTEGVSLFLAPLSRLLKMSTPSCRRRPQTGEQPTSSTRTCCPKKVRSHIEPSCLHGRRLLSQSAINRLSRQCSSTTSRRRASGRGFVFKIHKVLAGLQFVRAVLSPTEDVEEGAELTQWVATKRAAQEPDTTGNHWAQAPDSCSASVTFSHALPLDKLSLIKLLPCDSVFGRFSRSCGGQPHSQ